LNEVHRMMAKLLEEERGMLANSLNEIHG